MKLKELEYERRWTDHRILNVTVQDATSESKHAKHENKFFNDKHVHADTLPLMEHIKCACADIFVAEK